MALAAGISAVGSLAGGAASYFGSQAQAGAAKHAAQNELSMYNQTRTDLLPYIGSGSAALSQLGALLGIPNTSYNYNTSGLSQYIPGHGAVGQLVAAMQAGASPSQLASIEGEITSKDPKLLAAVQQALQSGQASTTGGNSASMLATLQNSPGYQWAVQQGTQAVDRSAAARGLLLSGGQLKDVTSYGQGMADQLYNQYYNQLYGLAGLGENAAAMSGNQGLQAAQSAGNFLTQGAGAQAAGYMGMANAFGGPGGVLQNSLLAYQLANPGYSGFTDTTGAPGGLLDQSAGLLDQAFANGTLSDRRAKADIKRIGYLDSGLPVYSYRYKGSRLPQMGVMADEVRKVAPHAVHRDRMTGLDRVDYKAVSKLPPMRLAA